jgi:hypothetical protein
MNHSQTTKTFLKVDRVNSHIETQVVISWDYEQESVEGAFDYGSKEENQKELARFESGELVAVWIQVKAIAEGETGTDSLGMCFCKAATLETDILNVVAENDMKNYACIDLRNSILCTAKRMKKFLDVKEGAS